MDSILQDIWLGYIPNLPPRHYHYTREYFRQYYASPIHFMHSTSGQYSLCSISFLSGTTCTLQSSSGYYCQSCIPFFPGTIYTVYFWSVSCKACTLPPRHYHYIRVYIWQYSSSTILFVPNAAIIIHSLLVSTLQGLYPSSQLLPVYFWSIFSKPHTLPPRNYFYTTVFFL